MRQRLLLKLSGEALAGPEGHGLDGALLDRFAVTLADAQRAGATIAVVVGGGNFFRGARGQGRALTRSVADGCGMLATMMNALALSDAVARQGGSSLAMSSVEMPRVAPCFERTRGKAALNAGQLLILGGGTGNPYVTTDSAAVLRAGELDIPVVIKATQVDGVYEADPRRDPGARRFAQLGYQDCLERSLEVMDRGAFELAQRLNLELRVCGLAGALLERALRGERVGTLVRRGAELRYSDAG